MTVHGHVDIMEGAYLTGWAIAAPDDGDCAITIVDTKGRPVAQGPASRHRDDLAALGFGRATLGFRIAVPYAIGHRKLHVLANGEELAGSPVITGPGVFDGRVAVEQDKVTGWVSERIAGFGAPFITIYNHLGVEVGRGQSAFGGDDADPFCRQARFAIVLDDQCFGAGEMNLSLRANNMPFAATACNLGLIGNMDTVSTTRCSGWLLSPQAPARVFDLELHRDGMAVASLQNDLMRKDLRNAYPDITTAGFDVTLEPESALGSPVTLSLRLAGTTRDLFAGPYVVASQAAMVMAAQRAARLAHADLPGIGLGERAVLSAALAAYLAQLRKEEDEAVFMRQAPPGAAPGLAIIIPIYGGVEATHACISAVLAHRNPETDRLILINDASPEPLMAPMLLPCAGFPNTVLLTNSENLGFVRTVNRGLGVAGDADVLLLNADTVLYAGGLEELRRVAAAPGIGTVTAMSNNATIFSYPGADLRRETLEDISWAELAALALARNAGVITDVPTGHGFCMLIKNEVIRRIGGLDEAFGRGYGEENDFCARAADLGYRNVAAGGVLVEHKEGISFLDEREGLMEQNLPRLVLLYPEYVPAIMAFERADGMRRLRWGLDAARLARAVALGVDFVLVVSNALEGGTAKAVRDIETQIGYGGAQVLTLSVNAEGLLQLSATAPLLLASFARDETAELLALLDVVAPRRVMVHQMLGFPADFITAFGPWLTGRKSVFWAHDFYTLCPRVTMIDAIGRFCGGADAATCARCVEMDGAHEASRLTALTPAAHRAVFAGLLAHFTHRLAPSDNAAAYLEQIFPDAGWEVVAHPESATGVAPKARAGDDNEIVMLGAIGPHKGSHLLLEIARRARLTHPHLRFRIIGYTNIDSALNAVGNVTITGKYTEDELPELLAAATGRLGLFLPGWPETYSYTLSELVRHGFIPLVPDIGAPADRVRAAKFGVVLPFPATVEAVLRTIDDIAAGRVVPVGKKAVPGHFFADPGRSARLRALTSHAPAAPGLVSARADAR